MYVQQLYKGDQERGQKNICFQEAWKKGQKMYVLKWIHLEESKQVSDILWGILSNRWGVLNCLRYWLAN